MLIRHVCKVLYIVKASIRCHGDNLQYCMCSHGKTSDNIVWHFPAVVEECSCKDMYVLCIEEAKEVYNIAIASLYDYESSL